MLQWPRVLVCRARNTWISVTKIRETYKSHLVYFFNYFSFHFKILRANALIMLYKNHNLISNRLHNIRMALSCVPLRYDSSRRTRNVETSNKLSCRLDFLSKTWIWIFFDYYYTMDAYSYSYFRERLAHNL